MTMAICLNVCAKCKVYNEELEGASNGWMSFLFLFFFFFFLFCGFAIRDMGFLMGW